MPRQLSKEPQLNQPRSREEALVKVARGHFERSLVQVKGELAVSIAALKHPHRSGAVNYGEVFLRDDVPVMV